jgi:hypothetical protein
VVLEPGAVQPAATFRRPTPRVGVMATGVHGRIAWHYAPAADICGFVVERDEHGVLTLRAHVANADDYKMTQPGLAFIVTLQRGSWKWPIVEVLGYRDHALFARLGPPEAKERK